MNRCSEAEIARVIEAYGKAAGDAKRLGFAGVEIHAAHGYLIDQFFYAETNLRTDRYGEGIAERTRFGCEVVQACRQAVGEEFPIFLRFSQWKGFDYSARLAKTPEELATFLQPLVDAGVDVFHCSTRRFWEPEFEGPNLNLAGWTKKLTGKPVITVGSVGLDTDFTTTFRERKNAGVTRIDLLAEMIARGEADLVAVGRALLNDPAWVKKIREGRQPSPFDVGTLKVLT